MSTRSAPTTFGPLFVAFVAGPTGRWKVDRGRDAAETLAKAGQRVS